MPRARNAAASTSRARSRRIARFRVWLTAAAFLLPAIIGLLILRIIPTVQAVGTSLTNQVGSFTFANFGYVFTDPAFLNALKVTLLFAIIINPIQIALALWLAVVLTKRVPGVGIWRTLILLPIAVPQIVSAIVWGVLFRPDGPLNGILESLGIAPVPWLVSPDTALLSIMIICTWVGVGYWMTFLVAGIKDIPSSLYEAAELDGAGGWKQFLYITLPGCAGRSCSCWSRTRSPTSWSSRRCAS